MPAPNPLPTKLNVIHAYRHLYRKALQAVIYSTPARYTIRDRLRLAFRKNRNNPYAFCRFRIRNTLQFLHGARNNRSLEHKVLRTLLHTWYWQDQKIAHDGKLGLRNRSTKTPQRELELRDSAYDQFNHMVRMLNESMGLCIYQRSIPRYSNPQTPS